MFPFVFRLLELKQNAQYAGEGLIELPENFRPAVGSLVALNLFTVATHSPFYIESTDGSTAKIRCKQIQIYDPFEVARYISTERWFNVGEVSEHDAECNKHLHGFYNELIKAEAKHPNWNRDAVYAAGILGEESGETLQAALDYQQDPVDREDLKAKISEEAIQTGAMSLRLLINADGFEHASKSLCVSQVSELSEMIKADVPPHEIVAALNEMIRRTA
jgi:hypothetical protein